LELQPRQYTWANVANLLFVDNPVGTGYSYVTDASLLTRNEEEIAADLLAFFVQFLTDFPEFTSTPFFIFSESYGGKMAVSFASALNDAIKSGSISMNFRGVACGDSWIDASSFVKTWGPYLLATSEVNPRGFEEIEKAAEATIEAVDANEWRKATELWGKTEEVIERVSAGVNFYNILARNPNTSFFLPSSSSEMDLDGDSIVSAWERRAASRITMGLPGDIDDELAALMNGAGK
jgi:serine carboxypeptidase 1